MKKQSLPVLPWTWTWRALDGRPLRPLELFLSRKFSFVYLAVIWAIWFGWGLGPEHECIDLGARLKCVGGLWPEEVFSDPLKFLVGIIVAPWFHNSWEHILFVTMGFMIFVQSFEVRTGSIKTILLFFSTIALAGILVALVMNLGEVLWPDSNLIEQGMGRNWMGGSAGFFGIIGASTHQSKSRAIVPLLAIIFEVWNSIQSGNSPFTSSAHMVSLLYGYLAWGWWTGAWKAES